MQSARERSVLLGDAALRRALSRSLEKRVPASEIDDLVQATLLDALAAKTAPADEAELTRWVYGILRNKVADHHRRRTREVPLDPERDEPHAAGAPTSARELLRWAEVELPEGEQAARTLDWMLEEGDGEKLESIARAEQVPAPRLRQRIARLRRHFRARWAAQVAAVISGIVVAIAIGVFVRRHFTAPLDGVAIAPEPSAPPRERARALRRVALERCERRDFGACLRDLDEAKRLDPAGDVSLPVRAARRAAATALSPREAPSDVTPAPSDVTTSPTTSAPSDVTPVPTTSAPSDVTPAPTTSAPSDVTPVPTTSAPRTPSPRATTTVPSFSTPPSAPRKPRGFSSL